MTIPSSPPLSHSLLFSPSPLLIFPKLLFLPSLRGHILKSFFVSWLRTQGGMDLFWSLAEADFATRTKAGAQLLSQLRTAEQQKTTVSGGNKKSTASSVRTNCPHAHICSRSPQRE